MLFRNVSLAFLLFLGAASPAYSGFSVNLDAGRLMGAGGISSLPADNSQFSYLGGLLLLISSGGDNNFSNVLNQGQFVSGNDFILAAGGFNTNGGTDETLTSFNVLPNAASGDLIALRWFPGITFADFLAGTVPVGGESFGTYNPRVSNPANLLSSGPDNPDGGDPWLIPSSGLINLNFFTDSSGVGSQFASEGFADFAVIPEPATWLAVSLGFVALLRCGVLRRRFV